MVYRVLLLHGLLGASDESWLYVQGARGMWELAVNKQHHGDHDVDASTKALVCHLSSKNETVRAKHWLITLH